MALEAALERAFNEIEPGLVARLDAVLAEGLPDQPYWPGITPRPGAGPVFEISGRAAIDVTPANWRESEAWAAGFVLMRRGYFWEAHEVLEPVWQGLPPNGPDRPFVQAAIQYANGRLKAAMGRDKAAARLFAIASAHLEDARSRGFRPGGDGP